jgi:phosphate transport system protein
MPDNHLSSKFDADLGLVLSRLLEMGGLVESQVGRAMALLDAFDVAVVGEVKEAEHQLNAMELSIDEEVSHIIVRWQPAARDLRLLLAISKCTTNLERAGDEACKIAKRTRRIAIDVRGGAVDIARVRQSGMMASRILGRSLDAFARADTVAAAQVVREDQAIDNEFRAFMLKLNTCMMEDPRTVPAGLDYLLIAKAIERIGDHAANIAEFAMYVANGTDVRHTRRLQLMRDAAGR